MVYGIIYKITNVINGKIYVGKTTTSINARFKRHISHALKPEKKHENLYLYNAMRKYGVENFNIEQIDSAKSLAELDKKEQYWISTLHTFIDDPLCNGYNMTIGGDGGHWSKESSEKAKATKLLHGTNKLSEETKKKISLSNKGKAKSDLHKQHLSDNHHLKTTHILYFVDGHTELSTNSIKKLAKRLNTSAIKLRRTSEVGEFRCGEFYLLDLTDLDLAFKHKYKNCKDKIVLDPKTGLYISPGSLRLQYRYHPDWYNNKMPDYTYISSIEAERLNFIKTLTDIKEQALKI